jgi:erythromycin esterase-like protein
VVADVDTCRVTTSLQTTPPPGWYHDPQTPSLTRYFDGIVWTQHVAPAGTPIVAEAPAES